MSLVSLLRPGSIFEDRARVRSLFLHVGHTLGYIQLFRMLDMRCGGHLRPLNDLLLANIFGTIIAKGTLV